MAPRDPRGPGRFSFPGVTMWRWLLDRIVPPAAVAIGDLTEPWYPDPTTITGY